MAFFAVLCLPPSFPINIGQINSPLRESTFKLGLVGCGQKGLLLPWNPFVGNFLDWLGSTTFIKEKSYLPCIQQHFVVVLRFSPSFPISIGQITVHTESRPLSGDSGPCFKGLVLLPWNSVVRTFLDRLRSTKITYLLVHSIAFFAVLLLSPSFPINIGQIAVLLNGGGVGCALKGLPWNPFVGNFVDWLGRTTFFKEKSDLLVHSAAFCCSFAPHPLCSLKYI
jgi:hypothetical protein